MLNQLGATQYSQLPTLILRCGHEEWETLEPLHPRAPTQTPVRKKKRKANDTNTGGAQALPTRPHDIGPHVNFMKVALMSALEGNVRLKLLLQEHEDTAKSTSDKID